MRRIAVNATGSDVIRVWYYENGKVTYSSRENRTWIFVSGMTYDLEFLERQLETLNGIETSWERLTDIFGERDGIKISLRPSMVQDMVYAIGRIGLGRKFQIYNADINPVLRYLSEKNITLFSLERPLDHDEEIPWISILPIRRGRETAGIKIGNSVFNKLDMDAVESMIAGIENSLVIIYDNTMDSLLEIFRLADRMDIKHRHVWAHSGKSYESYGQVKYRGPTLGIAGRICIPADSFIYSESGLTGIYQISRISSLPPETVALVTPGTAVSALEVSEAIRNDILIPMQKSDHEEEKSVEDLFTMDRGGTVLQPEPGIYQDVYEIDFSSMYPSIIVRYNISPETMSRSHGIKVPDSPYMVLNDRRGFLSLALEKLLNTRLMYKAVKSIDNQYAMRDAALKWLLLTSFGYTGYKNAKFGRIETHETITCLGRNILHEAMRLAEEHGFTVIHGIVDSLWLHGDGDMDALLKDIEKRTRINIVLDGHYRWIVFFPSRSGIGAVNRYLGLRYDGTYKFRGIDLRRNDIPGICKRFQIAALDILNGCRNKEEIIGKWDAIQELKRRAMKEVGKADPEDLYLHVTPSRHPEEYKVNNIQKASIEVYRSNGIDVNPGQEVSVIVNSWPMHQVSIIPGDDIDKKYYHKLLRRSFEIFDFILSCCKETVNSGLYDPRYSLSSQ